MRAPSRSAIVALLTAFALAAGAAPLLAQQQGQVEEEVSLNFVNAEIDAVLRALSQTTGKNFVIDPRVKGTLNIVTTRPVSPEVAYQMLLSALRLQGFAAVEERGVVKVVPEAEAKLQAVPVNRAGVRGDRLVTQVFSIKNESALQLMAVVRPLVAPNNTVSAYAANNSLVVTDYADNIERIRRIIEAIDVPQRDAIVIPVQHASAADVAATINRSFADLAGAAADPSGRITVVADARLNALVVRSSNPSHLATARRMAEALDQPGLSGNIHVIYLRNADATKVAQTLRGVLSGEAAASPAAGGAAPATPAPSLAAAVPAAAARGGEMVYADRMTNSLIVTAPEGVYQNVRRVVEMLDKRRVQVFVEALIAEVTADQASEIGIQWQSTNVPTSPGNGVGVFGGTNFQSGGSNILGLAASPASAGRGLNLLVGRGTITLPGSSTPILNLAVLARFLETQARSNILSTPNLVMLDNEEAKIVVGQNLPFLTGQYVPPGTGATPANPFQTIERRDVGLTLRIRPQISEGGTILMQILQESSSVVDTTNAAGPVTNKRSIETVALVDDGAIIALGGLVQDNYSAGVEKVPLLGDLPLIGSLFRFDTRQRIKTNLFVFLRPQILRDAESYQGLTDDRYEYVIGQQRSVDAPEKRMPQEGPAPELPADPMGILLPPPFEP